MRNLNGQQKLVAEPTELPVVQVGMRFLLEWVIAVSAMAALTHSFSLPAGFDMNEIKYVTELHQFCRRNSSLAPQDLSRKCR